MEKEGELPFDSYTVKFGNENKNGFDIKTMTLYRRTTLHAWNPKSAMFLSM